MKKMIKKTTSWLMILCMVIGFIPAFASTAAAQADDPVPAVVLAAPLSETETEESQPDTLFGLLWMVLKAIGTNLKSVSVDDVLKLPANVMDDVLTYLFAILKVFGVNVDSLFARISSLF